MFKCLLGCALLFWASAAAAAEKLQFGPPAVWVKPAAVSQSVDSEGEAAPFRRLLVDVQLNFGPEGNQTYTGLAMKIQTPQGLGAAGVAVIWKPDTEVVTIHALRIVRGSQVIDVLARGQTFTVLRRETNLERAMLDGMLTATLQPEGLRVGDVLEFAYTKKTLDPVLQGHSEMVLTQLAGQRIDRLRLRATWPTTKPVRLRKTADWTVGALSDTPDGQVFDAEFLAFERPPPPQGAPRRYAYGPSVTFSDYATWAEVSALMAPLYRKAATLAPSSPIRAEAARIRAAYSDPKAQAAAALRLVQDRIRYLYLGMDLGGYLPADADVTWTRAFGDCKAKTAVLLALLQELDIDAQPALVSTVAGDGMDQRLPNLELFNHILIRARIGGRTYWMDGTRTGDRSLDELAVPAFGWALPVLASGGTLEPLVVKPLDIPSTEGLVRIDATAGLGAPALVHIEARLRGDGAITMRQASASVSRADIDKILRKSFVSQFPGIDIERADLTFDEATGAVVMAADGTLRMSWSWHGDVGLFEHEMVYGRLGAVADYKRDAGPQADAPYAVTHPVYETLVETILLPQGGKGFALKGEDVDTTIAGVNYRRKARLENGTLTFDSASRSLASEFPAAEAPAAKQALRELWDGVMVLRGPKNYRESDAEMAIRLARTPHTVDGFIDRAEARFSKKQIDAALEDYDTAVKMEPADASVLNGRCFALGRAGKRLEEALADCNTSLDLEPKVASVLDSRGFAYFRLGRMDKAIADLSQALKIEPELAPSLYVRGLAKQETGDRKGGQQDIAAARKLDPDVVATYAAYGVGPGKH